MKSESKVKLSDIAQKLNVSTVTVSKALADKDGVGEELRQKIKVLADELGYEGKKDRKIRSDTASSTGNIGIVAPERFFDQAGGSFYWTLYNSLSRCLMSHGYYAIIEQISESAEFDLELPHVVQDKKVDGVIILGQISPDYAHYFAKNYEPFIFLDFYLPDFDSDSVVTDNFYMEYLVTQKLIDMGHRDIRFVGSFNVTSSINDRFMGFMKAMLENGLPASLQDAIPDRSPRGFWLPLELPQNLPTAFVCNCDECAVRVYDELTRRGIKVPDEVSITGFDDYIQSNYHGPSLATVSINFDDLARTTVELMLKKISGKPYNHGYTVVLGKLKDGDSVAPIRR